MSGHPSLLTGPQRCARGCGWTYWGSYGHVSQGDVRECDHGRLWVATGRRQESEFFLTLDEWQRLSRFGTPIAYRRAKRALANATPEGVEP